MKIIHNFPISKHHKILLEKELWDNHSQNHNMFGLQKSSGLLEVVREVPCSSPYLLQFPQSRIYSFWWSELIFFHLSLRYITVFCLFVWGFFFWGGVVHHFLGLLSFLKGHRLYLDSWVSSKSNAWSEGNLEKWYFSQIRVWLTKLYDRKCLQAKTLKKWSKVFKDWIKLIQFVNLSLCLSQGHA